MCWAHCLTQRVCFKIINFQNANLYGDLFLFFGLALKILFVLQKSTRKHLGDFSFWNSINWFLCCQYGFCHWVFYGYCHCSLIKQSTPHSNCSAFKCICILVFKVSFSQSDHANKLPTLNFFSSFIKKNIKVTLYKSIWILRANINKS